MRAWGDLHGGVAQIQCEAIYLVGLARMKFVLPRAGGALRASLDLWSDLCQHGSPRPPACHWAVLHRKLVLISLDHASYAGEVSWWMGMALHVREAGKGGL